MSAFAAHTPRAVRVGAIRVRLATVRVTLSLVILTGALTGGWALHDMQGGTTERGRTAEAATLSAEKQAFDSQDSRLRTGGLVQQNSR